MTLDPLRVSRVRAARSEAESTRKRTPEQQALFSAVCRLWARHKGWPVGRWPKACAYDAILIGRFVVKLGASLDFWNRAIAAAPTDAAFTWLTTGPNTDSVSRLEEWHANERLMAWKREKQAELDDDGKGIAAVMARVLARHPVERVSA